MARRNLFGGSRDAIQYCGRCGAYAPIIQTTVDGKGKEVRVGLCCSRQVDQERQAAGISLMDRPRKPGIPSPSRKIRGR